MTRTNLVMTAGLSATLLVAACQPNAPSAEASPAQAETSPVEASLEGVSTMVTMDGREYADKAMPCVVFIGLQMTRVAAGQASGDVAAMTDARSRWEGEARMMMTDGYDANLAGYSDTEANSNPAEIAATAAWCQANAPTPPA